MKRLQSQVIPIETPSGLPNDYHSLTREGQRKARINGCRQWLIDTADREYRAANLIKSTWLFDKLYLQPREDYDCGFYDMEPLPTPEMHWHLSRLWAMYRTSVSIAPRGSAKSTHGRKDSLMRLVTSPAYSFVYATSTHDNAKFHGQVCREQCYDNDDVNKDWGPEYNVEALKPVRGDKPTGVEHFYLNNGSHSRQVSVESRLRGIRPRRFRLDDPEYDAKGSTNMEAIREYMDQFLTKVVLPMVARRDCGADWTATFVSKKHYAWAAMDTFVDPATNTERAVDERFNYWARLTIPAAERDPDTGKLRSCWPEMWPVDDEEKERLKISDALSLEEIEKRIGGAAFRGEYMADPGAADDSFFILDTNPYGNHAWWIEESDPAYTEGNYLISDAKICYRTLNNGVESITKVPIRDFVTRNRLFCTVDTAYTENATSDRRCVMLMAITANNELFVLDAWSHRKKDAILIEEAFRICKLWRCPLIYVESVKDSRHVYHRFVDATRTRMQDLMDLPHDMVVKQLNVGMAAKETKIASLDLRFENNLIKLPILYKDKNPALLRLIAQINEFSPQIKDGGLQHDDEIDCVSMSLFVLKGKLRSFASGQTDISDQDPIAQLREGNLTDLNGMPYAFGVNLQEIPVDVISGLLDDRVTRTPDGRTRV